MSNETKQEHPSYGLISASHVSGQARLVGSPFNHQHYITITINEAKRYRSVSREYWQPIRGIAQTTMLEAQWIEFLSRPNMGVGVPCTIQCVNGQLRPDPPEEISELEAHVADMQETVRDATVALDAAVSALSKALESGRIGKTELRAIHAQMETAKREMQQNVPFVQRSFIEHVDAVVHKAAAEIEATVTGVAIRLGIEKMREISDGAPRMIESATEPAK